MPRTGHFSPDIYAKDDLRIFSPSNNAMIKIAPLSKISAKYYNKLPIENYQILQRKSNNSNKEPRRYIKSAYGQTRNL